jgi:amino acid adenylation domain-containing protein
MTIPSQRGDTPDDSDRLAASVSPHDLSTDRLASLSPDQRRLLLQKMLEQQLKAASTFGMSIGQQGLWYAFRRDPTSTAFNVFLPTRVVSPLDLDALQKSMNYLALRHASLRTTFSDKNANLRQTVHSALAPEFELIDAGHLDESELRKQVLMRTQRPFDLENGPLLRMVVFVCGPSDHVVLATTHHIVVDFWSLILVLAELREIYRSIAAGAEPSLPPPSNNYAAFVADQQSTLGGPRAEEDWQYWKRTLQGAPYVLNWFTDFQRPTSFSGKADVVAIPLTAQVAAQVNQVALELRCTSTAVVMAALQVFVSRYTCENDFFIGSPFAGRGQRRFETTVGFFVNMLPLRAELGDNPTFATLVRRASQNVTTAMQHESFPLAEIVRRVQPPRDPSRSPLFQVTCTFEKSHLREEQGRASFLMPTGSASADYGGLVQESFFVPHPTCHHDIEFIFERTDHWLRGMICFCRDLFDRDTVTSMAGNFASLINHLALSPHTRLSEIAWESSPITLPPIQAVGTPETLRDQIEDALSRYPDEIAFVDSTTSTSYRTLNRNSQRITDQLRLRGIGPGDLVPVIAERGPLCTTAIIGVIRSGAAVIPIDANQPAVALKELAEDTRPKCVLVDRTGHLHPMLSMDNSGLPICYLNDWLDQQGSSTGLESQTLLASSPTDLAYVIYTSGTTGRPKGVMIQQSAIANTIRWRCDHVKLSTNDRVLMLLSHQFDAGFGIAMSTLAQGATIVWPSDSTKPDIPDTIRTIRNQHVTVLPAVPSLVDLLIEHPRFESCLSLQQVWCGGEQMPSNLPSRIRNRLNVRIWNFYGPTEASVEATACDVTDHDPKRIVPIGYSIANTQVIVIDEAGRIVPDTVPGQIAIVGRGLALGYLNHPQLTEKVFARVSQDSLADERMYLTGDLGRRRRDGAIDFLGRLDQQVKLHGYRIELEEIECVLRMHPQVASAAVKIHRPDSPAAQLIAFVVTGPTNNGTPSPTTLLDELHRHIALHLPSHKRPSQVHCIDKLPLGTSGKVNRNLLPEVVLAVQASKAIVGPKNPFERHIASLWSELLEVSQVGIHENFFELGGSSLQAAMMTARLSEDLDLHVPTALVFDLADVSSIARRLVELHPRRIEQLFGQPSVASYSHVSSESTSRASSRALVHPLIATLNPAGNRDPIFMIHPPGGIVICYRELAMHLNAGRPFHAIRSRGLHGQESLPDTIQKMAQDYVEAIEHVQTTGPYIIGGWSLGGVIAYEVAKQLIDLGHVISKLILLDSTIPIGASELVDPKDTDQVGSEYGIEMTLDELGQIDEDSQLPFLWQHAANLGVLDDSTHPEVVQRVLEDLKHLFHHHVQLTSRYQMRPIPVSTLLIRPTDVPVQVKTSLDRGWGRLVAAVDVKHVPGHHHSMVARPHVSTLAQVIRRSLD